jgi:hypothetical protein
MAITYEQALTASEFHQEASPPGYAGPFRQACESINGPVRWRRNGKTQTWKRTPGQFKIPVKHGLRDYDYISNGNANLVHAAEDCPVLKIQAELNCPSVHEPRPAYGSVSRCLCGHGKRSACHGWS